MRLTICLAVVAACGVDPAPAASSEEVTPEALTPADDALDDLTITLRYEDGDGDLGGGVAEVHDCRSAEVAIELAIPPIAPEAGQPISGTLALHVNDIGAIASTVMPAACEALGVAPLAADTAVFCVVLVDVAGHRGAGDCTPAITLAAP
jgi:hypothetical protein